MTKGKIAIAGGTGFIGRRLAERFLEEGYEILIISRSASAELPFNAKVVAFDSKSPSQEAERELEGCLAIVNLAGASIAGKRLTDEYKKIVRASRVDYTAALSDLINSMERPPGIFVSASAVGIYGERGDEILTEKSEPGSGFLEDLCRDWEFASRIAVRSTVVCNPRLGIVLDAEEGSLPKQLKLFRLGLGGVLASGAQWTPWIHIDDVVELFKTCVEKKLSGAVNATSPEPVRNERFTGALARACGIPALLPVPKFALKLALGELAEYVLQSQRVVPEIALANGFKFKYEIVEPALQDIVNRKLKGKIR